MAGYERDGGGSCTWQGLIADPKFEHGCADWHLFRVVPNATDHVVAAIASSKLTLSVDHRCSIAGAQAAAFFPTQSTLPNPAVAITASGTAGANLHVSFDNFTVSAPTRMPLAGTGSTKRYVACLPAGAARKAVLALTVGESGTCAEPLEDTFEVRSLEVISENQCAP